MSETTMATPATRNGSGHSRTRRHPAVFGLAPAWPSLVGVAEIAHAAGVGNAAVINWGKRHPDFPRPLMVMAAGPVWVWAGVAEWLTIHDMPKEAPTPAIVSADDQRRNARLAEITGRPFGWFTGQRRGGVTFDEDGGQPDLLRRIADLEIEAVGLRAALVGQERALRRAAAAEEALASMRRRAEHAERALAALRRRIRAALAEEVDGADDNTLKEDV